LPPIRPGNPFATTNFSDLEKEFAQLEQESKGVKKYNPNDLSAFEAELKAMEEEELKDVDFEKGQLGDPANDQEFLQQELTEQVKKLGPDKGDTKLTDDDIAVINNTIALDVKEEAIKKAKLKVGKNSIKKESIDSIFTGLKEIKD